MPTSAHQLAVTLGYANGGYVHRKYPELCREISEKIALAKQTRSDYVRSLLENALDEHPAPTLKDLSRRFGYSNSAVLRAHQPDLCDRLLARHRTHTLERRATLERMTIEALGETDVPSVRVLCKRLGITVWFMNKYFPAVRRMVAKRHRNCVAAETQRRHERLWRDVHHIVVELRNQGLYPSATRINERLPQGSCREWKALALAIRDAHKALRISK